MNYADMTDEELRVEIGKRRGWMFIGKETASSFPPDFPYAMPTPRWPTEIEPAWRLVEEIRAAGFRVGVWQIEHEYSCSIVKPVYFGEGDFCEGMKCEAEAQALTAPRAICLAWLAWKDGTK